MNTKTFAIAILTGLAAITPARAEDAPAFTNEKDKISYSIGVTIGNMWKRQEIEASDVNFDALVRGFKTSLNGDKLLVPEPEMQEVLAKFQQNLNTKQQEKRQVAGDKNKKEGETFLAENKSKPGVITMTNGLQYKVVTEGKGELPKQEDRVSVNYRGTLIDGTEFDSSAKAGHPASFPVTGVIPGWTHALLQMKVGSKWQLFIPADLAYGERGAGRNIGPNATLIFDVELLSIEPPPPPPAPLTSDIIKVPSLEEMKKGAKIETIKAEDVEKLQKEEAEKKAAEEKK